MVSLDVEVFVKSKASPSQASGAVKPAASVAHGSLVQSSAGRLERQMVIGSPCEPSGAIYWLTLEFKLFGGRNGSSFGIKYTSPP